MNKGNKHPVILIVLDGWGIRKEKEHNGIALSNTPNFNYYRTHYSYTTLQASGNAVGLPAGQMGNSEVGHTTIGAGKVYYQDLVRITDEINSNKIASNEAFLKVFSHVLSRNSHLHVIGLLSNGGVHSHEDHFIATIKLARQQNVQSIILHPFLDGRDSSTTSGVQSLKKLEAFIQDDPCISIGSIMGRYYAMDRDYNWDRTAKAFHAIFNGQADSVYQRSVLASQILLERYQKQMYDEHIEPIVFTDENGKALEVQSSDGIIFTNFRKDRARQLSIKIGEYVNDSDLCFVTMTDYGSEVTATCAYKPDSIENTLGSIVADAHLSQVHIAETEKYPHVTYYFNGGREKPFDGETDILIPSRKDVKTHDQAPQMRVREITDAAINSLQNNDFLFINYANADMVGHTANENAIIAAVESVDQQLGRLVEETLKANGTLLIIADHGNAELMKDPETLEPHTAHTCSPVPCILISEKYRKKLRGNGGLQDVAPTVLKILGLSQPSSMMGTSLY